MLQTRNIFLKIMLLCIGVYCVQVAMNSFITAPKSSISYFALHADHVWDRPYTIVLSVFSHGSLLHLLHNMFALTLFGYIVEKMTGEAHFLRTFLVTGIGAGLISLYFYPHSHLLGASGAISGLVGFIAAIRPTMMLYWGYPMPAILLALVWLITDTVQYFYPLGNIGYANHVAGIVIGFCLGLYYRKELSPQEKEVENDISEEEVEAFEDEFMIDNSL